MEVQLNREGEFIKVERILIKNDENVEFIIHFNKFGELILNKQQHGEGEGSIVIMPSVSNEIRIK
jgi:hypothetical protein